MPPLAMRVFTSNRQRPDGAGSPKMMARTAAVVIPAPIMTSSASCGQDASSRPMSGKLSYIRGLNLLNSARPYSISCRSEVLGGSASKSRPSTPGTSPCKIG